MRLPFEIEVALRYLRAKKRHSGISASTLISVAGIAVGVGVLLLVLSVMSGFMADLQTRILGVSSHLVLLDYSGRMGDYEFAMDRASSMEHVTGVSPFVLGQAMLAHEGKARGVYIRGVRPELEERTTEIRTYMREGGFVLGRSGGLPSIVIGSELASELGAKLGSSVRLVAPFGLQSEEGASARVQEFQVAGIFEVGMYEFDSGLVVIDMKEAQDYLGFGDAASGIEIKLDDIYLAPEIGRDLRASLGQPYYARDWMEMNRNLFTALRLQKLMLFVILTLIVLVAAFNIISTQVMNVIEKESQIAILKTMGATDRSVMGIFMIQGFIIGLAGTALGMCAGVGAGWALNRFKLVSLPPDIYFISHLSASVSAWDVAAVSVAAIAISFLATIYPAWRAARLEPVEPLRYESH